MRRSHHSSVVWRCYASRVLLTSTKINISIKVKEHVVDYPLYPRHVIARLRIQLNALFALIGSPLCLNVNQQSTQRRIDTNFHERLLTQQIQLVCSSARLLRAMVRYCERSPIHQFHLNSSGSDFYVKDRRLILGVPEFKLFWTSHISLTLAQDTLYI